MSYHMGVPSFLTHFCKQKAELPECEEARLPLNQWPSLEAAPCTFRLRQKFPLHAQGRLISLSSLINKSQLRATGPK